MNRKTTKILRGGNAMNPWKRKRNGRGLLSVLLVLAMVCSLFAGTDVAAVADENNTVAKIGETEYTDLAAAISAAEGGDTITVVADVTLSSTVTISDKSITIKSEDGKKISGESTLATFFTIAEGASLTLSGSLVIDGTGAKIPHKYALADYTGNIVVKGTLTLKDSVKIQNFTIGAYCGVVLVDGSDAELNIDGGSICENKLGNESQTAFDNSGTVSVSNGGTVNMTGGSITNNKEYLPTDENKNITSWKNNSPLCASPGIFICSGGTVNISGGEISNNTGFRGSAINVYGWTSGTYTVNISNNALITKNTYGDAWYWEDETGTIAYWAAGPVYIYCRGTINMSGGTISDNKGGMGGGVTVESFWSSGMTEYTTAYFNMTGGTISGNTARSGGGIYSYSTGVSITGGMITDNEAENLGGGIYSEGNSKEGYGTVYLKNAIITNNTASLEGGGLWLCPTGGSTIYVTDGCAIYGNSATYDSTADYYAGDENETTPLNGSAAGDDVASGSQAPYSLTLAPRILGGGSVYYYTDGGLDSATNEWPEAWKTANNPYWDSETSASIWPYPVVNSKERYGSNSDTEAKKVVNSTEYWALKSQAEAIELAESLATVVISGNKAAYGGGIGANGGVVIGGSEGDGDLASVTVTKSWAEPNEEHPDSVTVWLTNTVDGVTYKIQSAELNSENSWTYTFTNLPKNDKFSYSVVEEDLSGYTCEVTGNAENGFTITNTRTSEPNGDSSPSTNVTVSKVWILDDGASEAASVTVNLYGNGVYVASATLSAANGWSYTWYGLDSTILWLVEEASVPIGFASSVTRNGNVFIITNDDIDSGAPDVEIPEPVEAKLCGSLEDVF